MAEHVVQQAAPTFDLFRMTRGSVEVGISHNTLRKYGREGLPLYKKESDRSIYVSRRELEAFIRSKANVVVFNDLGPKGGAA